MPTRQEEIREGINERIGNALIAIGCGEGSCPHAEMKALEAQEDCLNSIWTYLHSAGCVLKVDRELPITKVDCQGDIKVVNQAQQDMLKAGFVATIPLIEVISNE